VQVSNSFGIKKGTSVTFNVAFPYTNLVALPYGQYWFSGYALMQPYTTPPVSVALINTILTNAEQQILVRNSWITSINNLTNMSALGKTITTANKALLVSQINAIITQTNAYLAILTKTPNASMSVLQAITTAQAALTAYTIPVPK
jgi:hypothetical protein